MHRAERRPRAPLIRRRPAALEYPPRPPPTALRSEETGFSLSDILPDDECQPRLRPAIGGLRRVVRLHGVVEGTLRIEHVDQRRGASLIDVGGPGACRSGRLEQVAFDVRQELSRRLEFL